MTCPVHGQVRPCGGIDRPNNPDAPRWCCDPSKPHCPKCGKPLRARVRAMPSGSAEVAYLIVSPK